MTELITDLIKKDNPFIFAKFGDGEYAAAKKQFGRNCDGDPFTNKLGDGINAAINYYSLVNNAYCGKWRVEDNASVYFNSIVSGKVNWIDYQTCLIDDHTFSDKKKLNLYKAIKDSGRKKVLIANELLVKAKYLLDIDKHLIIPYRNWVETEFEKIVDEVVSFFGNDEKPLILTCAGMGSKVLIMELHKKFPNGMFIDIGSGLDYLCTKKCSRGNVFSYEAVEKYFEEILPSNWNDPQFEHIYQLAKNNIGIHLPK